MRTVLVAAVCSAVAGLGMAPSSVLAKTVKECRAEWQAHKDIFQSKGISENEYVEECRDFPAPETPAATNAAPAASVPAVVKPAHVAVAAPVALSHFSTEAQAKANCRSHTVVWAEPSSRTYHLLSDKDYGPKHIYMCERDATGQGFHAARTKKPEDTHRIVSRDEFKSKLPPQFDRSARNRNAQPDAVASPPPASLSDGPSCLTRHSGSIIHSERCGF